MVSARIEQIIGKVHSDKGFYIGDVCYVLDQTTYDEFWGGVCGFDDGCFEVPGTGYSFGVGSTAYGDGCYNDDDGNMYGVDAGVIGIVPLELCKRGRSGGNVFELPGDASFDMFEGRFKFVLPGNKVVKINTADEENDEEYDYDREESYWDGCEDDDSAEGWD